MERKLATATNYDAIPQELKLIKQRWVYWARNNSLSKIPKYLNSEDGKTCNARPNTMPPIPGSPDYEEKKAKFEAAKATWRDYDEVEAQSKLLDQQPQRYADSLPPADVNFKNAAFKCGVGFILTGTPYLVVDLDHCLDQDGNIINSKVLAIFKALSSYTEISPSGRGLHIFLKGKKPNGAGKDQATMTLAKINGFNIEIYDHARYMTVTGDIYKGLTEIRADRDKELAEIYYKYIEPQAQQPLQTVQQPKNEKAAARDERPADLPKREMTEEEKDQKAAAIFKKLKASRNKDVVALCDGVKTNYENDDSRADLAFCNDIKFHTNDATIIDKVFRLSGLYREKWDRKTNSTTYGWLTIGKALEDQPGFINASRSDAQEDFNNDVTAAEVGLDEDFFDNIDVKTLVNRETLDKIFAITNLFERQTVLALAEDAASRLKFARNFGKVVQAYKKEAAKHGLKVDNNRYTAAIDGGTMDLDTGKWIVDNSGVYCLKRTPNGDYVKDYASHIIIYPAAIYHNLETGLERIKLTFLHNVRKPQSITKPRKIIANNNKIIDLADNGIEVNSTNNKSLVSYLADIVDLNSGVLPRQDSVSHLGWTEAGFLPYDNAIRCDSADDFKPTLAALCACGDFKAWTDYISPLRENMIFRLTMDASLASVLIGKLNALPFIYHLWGKTESGKTVALMSAASVWGKPKGNQSLVRTMNATINSIMASAGFLHDLPFFGDELQTIKSRYENYKTLIMCVCEGINRGRLNADSSQQPTFTWNNAFLFTGEEPITASTSGGGEQNRVIEIEASKKLLLKNGNEIVNFITDNYGTAGPVFIDAVKNAADLRQQYNEIFARILEEVKTTDKQAASMALLVVADQIAGTCLFQGQRKLTVNDIREYLKTEEQVNVGLRAAKIIAGIIAEHDKNFATKYTGTAAADFGTETRYSEPLEFWGRRPVDSGVVDILRFTLDARLKEQGFEINAVLPQWRASKFLVPPQGGARKYDFYSSTNGNHRAYYVRLDLDTLDK